MTKSTITRERLEEIVSDPMINQGSEFAMMARMALAAMESEADCKERKLFCSTDTARMRKVISASAGTEDAPLYRHAQPAVDSDFIPKNLDKALGVVGVAIPESREEFNLQAERWIQRLIDRVIRYADEFQEQPAPVVPVLTKADFENWCQKTFALSASYFEKDANGVYMSTLVHDLYVAWEGCRAAMLNPDKARKKIRVIVLGASIGAGFDATASGNSPAQSHGWIPVSERMPEDEQEVLTINKMGHRFVSFFDKHSGLFFDRLDAPAACCIEHVLVTHWMPLPAAPQEGKP